MKRLPKNKKYVYCLHTVNLDRTYYNDFKWRTFGYVEASDFSPSSEYGHGLYGYLRGEGSY